MAGAVTRTTLAAVTTVVAFVVGGCGAQQGSPGASANAGSSFQELPSGSVSPLLSLPDASASPGGSAGDIPGDVPVSEGSYHSGTATLRLSDGSTHTLTKIDPGPHVFTLIGSEVVWTDGQGWYLTASGAPAEPGDSSGDTMAADVVIDHVVDGRHLEAVPPEGCQTTVDEADAAGFHGTATCTHMRWTDMLFSGGGFDPEASPSTVPEMPAFDARITFEARP